MQNRHFLSQDVKDKFRIIFDSGVKMKVNIQEIKGNWDLGYSLDIHTLKSEFLGNDPKGDPTFNTTRSEAGEALFQLKYRSNFSQISVIAAQIHKSLSNYFSSANLIIPMPPSKKRERQPVIELAKELAKKMQIPCYENLLIKTDDNVPLKDINNREEKIKTLENIFSVNDQLSTGLYNVLIIDDLIDSGSSLEAATNVLRNYPKVDQIYVSVVTRRKNA